MTDSSSSRQWRPATLPGVRAALAASALTLLVAGPAAPQDLQPATVCPAVSDLSPTDVARRFVGHIGAKEYDDARRFTSRRTKIYGTGEVLSADGFLESVAADNRNRPAARLTVSEALVVRDGVAVRLADSDGEAGLAVFRVSRGCIVEAGFF